MPQPCLEGLTFSVESILSSPQDPCFQCVAVRISADRILVLKENVERIYSMAVRRRGDPRSMINPEENRIYISQGPRVSQVVLELLQGCQRHRSRRPMFDLPM